MRIFGIRFFNRYTYLCVFFLHNYNYMCIDILLLWYCYVYKQYSSTAIDKKSLSNSG